MAQRPIDDPDRGARIRQLREAAGHTRDSLAAAAGIGKPGRRNGATIGEWEDGCNGTVSGLLAIVSALAVSLGRSKADLLTFVAFG